MRLVRGQTRLVVAEGIETALSLASGLLTDRPSIWAALSASGMISLRLPSQPGRLTVAGDGDPAGRAAAEQLARRASDMGWQVSLMTAPEGKDWNDVLREREGML
nr:toprim domain-containing protein [uncultured Celeribacter sp.]